MAVKDFYGNNLIRGRKVKFKDSDEGTLVGEVSATDQRQSVWVVWPDGSEEMVEGVRLQHIKKGL